MSNTYLLQHFLEQIVKYFLMPCFSKGYTIGPCLGLNNSSLPRTVCPMQDAHCLWPLLGKQAMSLSLIKPKDDIPKACKGSGPERHLKILSSLLISDPIKYWNKYANQYMKGFHYTIVYKWIKWKCHTFSSIMTYLNICKRNFMVAQCLDFLLMQGMWVWS